MRFDSIDDEDRALEILEGAVDIGIRDGDAIAAHHLHWRLQRSSDIRSLAGNPRYEALFKFLNPER